MALPARLLEMIEKKADVDSDDCACVARDQACPQPVRMVIFGFGGTCCERGFRHQSF